MEEEKEDIEGKESCSLAPLIFLQFLKASTIDKQDLEEIESEGR